MGRNGRERVADEWMETGKVTCSIAKHFHNPVPLLYAFYVPSYTLILNCAILFPKYLRIFLFNSYVSCTCSPKV